MGIIYIYKSKTQNSNLWQTQTKSRKKNTKIRIIRVFGSQQLDFKIENNIIALRLGIG